MRAATLKGPHVFADLVLRLDQMLQATSPYIAYHYQAN